MKTKSKLAIVLIVACIMCIFITACNNTASSEESSTETIKSESSTEIIESESSLDSQVEEDQISQQQQTEYITHNDICTQDEYENTLFNQPISRDRNGEIRIGIKCTHDYFAELTIYEAIGEKYVAIFNCPAVIGKNGPGKQAEGDTKTPLGTWTIGKAYGIKDDPGALLPYTKVTEDMYWCATGNHGTKYNQLIYRSEEPEEDYKEDEHLIDYPGVYNYFIDLGYNKSCAPYAGNAIFLHVWRAEDHPTGGCVAVSEENIITILKMVPSGTTVTIY